MRLLTRMVTLTLAMGITSAMLAQSNTWTQKADFGGIARYGAVGFSIGTIVCDLAEVVRPGGIGRQVQGVPEKFVTKPLLSSLRTDPNTGKRKSL